MELEPAGQPRIFLSTLRASASDWRQAGASIAAALLIFAVLAPVARTPFTPVWAFIPSYQSALIVSDLITSILLVAQFTILGDRSLLAVGLGYLFTAMMAIVHALSFPGLFAASGVLGGDQQTTAWLYMGWHAGFPLAVSAYALLSGGKRVAPLPHGTRRAWIAAGTALTAGAVYGLMLLTTAGHALLPAIMTGNHYTDAMLGTVGTIWGLSLAAFLILMWRRPHSVLDLWLMVVMVAWLCDVGLSAVLNGGRFDLGFYAGRIFGLFAASFVLLVLLLETIALYGRLANSFEQERQERDRRLNELQQELIHVGRVNELGQMVSALTHELRQPLTAASNYLAAGEHLLRTGAADKSVPVLGSAAQQIVRANDVIERIREFVRKGEVARRPEDLAATIGEAAALAMAGGQGQGVTLDTFFDPALRPALIDRVQIQQVVLNLMRNAIEAMADASRRALAIRATRAADDTAEISIADTGPGLNSAVREKLFQPFVTTKSAGMGVGLSICRSIIELHGGVIWTSDNPGGGTVFHFTVPCSPAAEQREITKTLGQSTSRFSAVMES